MSNIPKKNGNLLQCHLAFLQKTKERRRWSVASIPSSGYGTTTPASSNSQCSLNVDDHYSCNCLQYGTNYHSNHSQQNSQSNQLTISNSANLSSKLLHNSLTSTLTQHLSSNDSNPSLDDDGKILPSVHFRPRSRSLSSPVRSSVTDSKASMLESKENLMNLMAKSSVALGTLTFRRRSRSLSSPIRSPGIENRFSQMSNVYKERFPNAINQMNEKLEQFVLDNPELISEVASDAVTRFVHHQVIEMAKDCLQKSKDELLTSFYFHEISESLEKLLNECREKSPSATQHLKTLIKKLLLIISRPARLLECLEFNPEEFYRFLEVAEGQAKTVEGIRKDLPKYIINKLGISRDPLTEFKELDEKLHETLNLSTEQCCNKNDKNSVKLPNENDYETIKLISNGAYGAVYLVKYKKTNQRFAMKKINKQNLVLRNQIEQAFAERDIMCFTDNPFVVSLFCSFETKLHLCMVMEYVEGGDCATLLKSMGPFPVDLAKFYFAETVLAVEYLHSYGIVHRDLKPDNLLITSLGHIKLTDFGLSKIGLMNLATNLYEGYLDKDTKKFNDKQVYGTPEYIAPEVILRQGYGKPVDWWSMGIILYEFLIGCVPFFGETAEELFSHVINDEIEWPSDEEWHLPEEAKYIITQFLMPNPIDRLGTSGAAEIKEHPFFNNINWNALLRQKAEFVPQLIDEYDTSYFDTRLERYNHELGDSEGLNDSDESPLFSSFSSCSPRYHKVYSKIEKELLQEKPTKSSSTSSIVDETNKFNYQLSKMNMSTPEYSSTTNLLRALSLNEDTNESKDNFDQNEINHIDLNKSDSSIIIPNNYLSSIESRRCDFNSKDILLLNSEKLNKKDTPYENRPLTPSIKEIPPDDSFEENKTNDSEEKNLDLDENKLSLNSKSRSVIKSASASGLSQILPDMENQNYNKSEQRRSLNYESFSSSLLSQSGSLRMNSKKKTLSKNLKNDSPSKKSFRQNSYLHENSIRRSFASPYCSSTSSRDTSPSCDLKNRKKSLKESHQNTNNEFNISGSKNNLSSKSKAPFILHKSNLGFGFSFKAIRVYYGDSDVYTVHHLVYNVEPNSPASEAGLKPGDLITHINSESLQGLLHHQVLHLVLSGGDILKIRTTPLEYTSIKKGGRRRNPNLVKLAKRCGNSISNRYHYHKRSSNCLLANNDSLSASVLKRTDSDKRRKSSSLVRGINSKRSSTEINQLLSTSSNVFLPLDNSIINQEDNNLDNITSSKSFQYLGIDDKNEHLNNKSFSIYSKKPYSHLLHQCSMSDSSQSSSPSSSLSNSPANLNNLNLQTNKQSISNHFSRPNTLNGLKHKLVQTFRSPRRKSCGHIPLSPLARNSSPSSSCANTSTPGSNLLSVSPTRSPSPLAFSNNGQFNNHRQNPHMHQLYLNSQLHCHNQFLKQRCNVNHNLNETSSSYSPCIKVQCSSSCTSSFDNNSPIQCQKLNACLSDKETKIKNMVLNNHSCSSSHFISRPKSAEPDTLPVQHFSCKNLKPKNLETLCYLNKQNCNCKLHFKKGCNCYILQPSSNNNLIACCSNLNMKKSSNCQNLYKQNFEKEDKKEINEKNQVKYSSTILESKDVIERNENESDLKEETSNLEIENETSFECTNLDLNENRTILNTKDSEIELEIYPSPSKKIISILSSSDSTFSKMKKTLGSPIYIRKTLFKQNSDKRNKNNTKTSKEV